MSVMVFHIDGHRIRRDDGIDSWCASRLEEYVQNPSLKFKFLKGREGPWVTEEFLIGCFGLSILRARSKEAFLDKFDFSEIPELSDKLNDAIDSVLSTAKEQQVMVYENPCWERYRVIVPCIIDLSRYSNYNNAQRPARDLKLGDDIRDAIRLRRLDGCANLRFKFIASKDDFHMTPALFAGLFEPSIRKIGIASEFRKRFHLRALGDINTDDLPNLVMASLCGKTALTDDED